MAGWYLDIKVGSLVLASTISRWDSLERKVVELGMLEIPSNKTRLYIEILNDLPIIKHVIGINTLSFSGLNPEPSRCLETTLVRALIITMHILPLVGAPSSKVMSGL